MVRCHIHGLFIIFPYLIPWALCVNYGGVVVHADLFFAFETGRGKGGSCHSEVGRRFVHGGTILDCCIGNGGLVGCAGRLNFAGSRAGWFMGVLS